MPTKPVVKLQANWRDGSLRIEVHHTPNDIAYGTLQLRSADVQQRLRAGQLSESAELAMFNRVVDVLSIFFAGLGCEVLVEHLT